MDRVKGRRETSSQPDRRLKEGRIPQGQNGVGLGCTATQRRVSGLGWGGGSWTLRDQWGGGVGNLGQGKTALMGSNIPHSGPPGGGTQLGRHRSARVVVGRGPDREPASGRAGGTGALPPESVRGPEPRGRGRPARRGPHTSVYWFQGPHGSACIFPGCGEGPG